MLIFVSTGNMLLKWGSCNIWRNSLYLQTRAISIKKFDPKLVEKLKEQVDERKTFKNVYLQNFDDLYDGSNSSDKEKIEQIINIYDDMKYNLENVPSTLLAKDMKRMMQLDSFQNIKHYIIKLYRKELNVLLIRELQKINRETFSVAQNENVRSGMFDENDNLVYGLWHNTMFLRIIKYQKRLRCDKIRFMNLFGQPLYIDFSFAKYMNHSKSAIVVNDLVKLINHNSYKLREPFQITICGVDYESQLWKTFSASIGDLLESIYHTDKLYLDLANNKSKIIYFTCMEKNEFLNDEPDNEYVLAAVSERDIHQDFLIPQLQKLGVQTRGVPVDQHILWNTGSKRFSLFTKYKMLNDICKQKNWKDVLLDNIVPRNIKTMDQVIVEDKRMKLRKNNLNKYAK